MSSPTLHFDVHQGDGPPVLLVHGIMAGRALWNANLTALRRVSTPVVVELHGHGRSTTPTDMRAYQWQWYSEEFERIRSDVGVDRWFVGGQSLGAALTLRYVIAYPERVIGHVMTNSVSALSSRVASGPELAEAAQQLEVGGRAALNGHRLNPARSRRIVPAVRDGLVEDQVLLDPHGIAMAMRHTVDGISSRANVGENHVPTLVVSGTREAAFEEPCAFAETQMPLVRVARVDAGHSPNAETPHEFNRVVTDFFTELLTVC